MDEDIRKKHLIDDQESSDSPDQDSPDGSGSHFGNVEGLESNEEIVTFDEPTSGEKKPTQAFSLDDFDESFQNSFSFLEQNEETSEETPPAESPDDAKDAASEQKSINPATKKLCMIIAASSLCLLVLAVIGIKTQQRRMESSETSRTINSVIRHPISMHHYRHPVEIFLLKIGQEQEDLVTLGLELDFINAHAQELILEKGVDFRDLIYGFLQNEHPDEESKECWQPVVEEKLLAYLRISFPKSGLHSIRINRFNRL